MCVMGLVRPAIDKEPFTPDYIESIYNRGNNDGFGMGFVEGERYTEGPKKGQLIKPGRVVTVKSMQGIDDIKKLYQEQLDKGLPFIFHLRNATAGEKIVENCHPYQILSIDDGDPIDLWMFHNGTLRNAWLNHKMSDSWNFATIHLRGLLRGRPSMLYEEGFRAFLATMIEGNKLIFLDNRERVSIVNHNLGSYHPKTGVWLSTKDNIQPHVSYTQRSMHPMGFGAGRGGATNTQNNESDTSSGTSSSNGPRVTWRQPDGGKWVMSADGRSHYIPPTPKIEDPDEKNDAQTPLLPSPEADSVNNQEFITNLIKKSSPPKKVEDYQNLKVALDAMTQTDVHNYVQTFPVEAAYMLRYEAGMWPDMLPEFVDMTVNDIIVYCLENPWNSAYALTWASRQKMEGVHEVG